MKRTVCQGKRRLEYILIRSQRRDVLFKALPEGETRVYAPAWIRLRDVDDMVRSRIGELEEMHRRVDFELAQNRLEHPVSDGSRICVEGKARKLLLERSDKIEMQITEENLLLRLPDASDDGTRSVLRQVLSGLALERIRERLSEYAPKIGVQFGRVTIREQKSRWGSCSAKGNLNFNWKLIMAPPEVLNYVVIHELCHLIEFNHSNRFWTLVETQMPEYALWKKWLKLHGAELGI